MAFPVRLLNEDEEIVLDLRPHWWFLRGPAGLLAVALVALVWALSADLPTPALWALAAVTLAALAWFVGRYLRWVTSHIVLTTDRLVHRHGLLAKHGVEISLGRIHTVDIRQSLVQRLVGAGDLSVDAGGEDGQRTFLDVSNPGGIRQEITRQVDMEQRRRVAGTRGGGAADDLVDRLERLDALRQRGVLTDAEFQAQKARLLEG